MSFMRFSAAPAGRLSDRSIPWVIFGERPEVPDGLEDSALAGVNLAQIASSPGAPMFEPDSIFGAHMAGNEIAFRDDGPVVVFVHGFQYEPRRPVVARTKSDNPHRAIFHFDETPDGPGSLEERRRHITPWFARAMLEAGRGQPDECTGLAVGYSYASYGGVPERFLPRTWDRVRTRAVPIPRIGSLPQVYVNAYQDAEKAGFGLAAVLTQLRAKLDDEGLEHKNIDIFCHSLGVRTVLSALALVAQRWPNDLTLGRIDRVIMLNGACYWGQAAYALANISFAASEPRPQFYNFTSRSDDVLAYLADHKVPQILQDEASEELSLEEPRQKSLLRDGRTIGMAGKPPNALYDFFGEDYSDWIDIPLDSARVAGWGSRKGFRLKGRRAFSLGDHCMSFTHPGNWALYRAILHERDGWATSDLARELGSR